jgi:hypothetical protein
MEKMAVRTSPRSNADHPFWISSKWSSLWIHPDTNMNAESDTPNFRAAVDEANGHAKHTRWLSASQVLCVHW